MNYSFLFTYINHKAQWIWIPPVGDTVVTVVKMKSFYKNTIFCVNVCFQRHFLFYPLFDLATQSRPVWYDKFQVFVWDALTFNTNRYFVLSANSSLSYWSDYITAQ